MAVVIDSGPVTATQRLADVPRERWRDLVSERRFFCAVHLPHDCRSLLQFVEDAHDMLGPLGYHDVEEFITRGLGLDPALVTWAVNGLKQLKPDEPIPFDRAITIGKQGGDRKSEEARSTLRCKVDRIQYGTREHWLARLDRDGHHLLAANVRAGNMSAHAAAKEVGYRRIRTPLEQLRHWWAKASADERSTFMTELGP